MRPAPVLFVLLAFLTGVLYPLLVTAIAGTVFPRQARGSIVLRDGIAVGSELIGQSFSDPKYFWSRPSATLPQAYNGMASGGSNLGPLNPALIDAVTARIRILHAADPGNKVPVPIDLVTASGSGLDPHISIAAAQYQVGRISRARNLSLPALQDLLAAHAQSRLAGFLGEPRVNVLELNLALDELMHAGAARAP
jgi:K+-transporting ATPase ATPase C chain